MSILYGFNEEDFKRIVRVVLEIERRTKNMDRDRHRPPPVVEDRWLVSGILKEPLPPGGSAEMDVYLPGASGGVGDATEETVTVVDFDQLEDEVPEDTPIHAGWSGGQWVIISHPCI